MERKMTVVWLFNSRLQAVRARLTKNGLQVIGRLEQSFSSHSFDELTQVLARVKKELKDDSVRLLLPEEKTFLRLLAFPLSQELNRDLVMQEAQELIPENLREGYFDWRRAGETAAEKKVQVFAASQVYLNFVRQAAEQAGLKIEAFESPSLALARLSAAKDHPVIITFPADELIVCACYQGAVVESLLLEDEARLEEKIISLKAAVKNVFGLEVGEVIREGLDPVQGTMMKEDLKGVDERVLNLPAENTDEQISNSMPNRQEGIPMEEGQTNNPEVRLHSLVTPTPRRRNKKAFLWGLLAVVLVAAVVAGVLFLTRDKESAPEPAVSPTPFLLPTVPPSETITPTPVSAPERGDLKIRVLNGSGTPGGAGMVQEYLEGLGYEVVSVGNADNFDYGNTEFSLKEGAEEYREMLTADLAEKYSLASEVGTVEEESEYDALVILGAN